MQASPPSQHVARAARRDGWLGEPVLFHQLLGGACGAVGVGGLHNVDSAGHWGVALAALQVIVGAACHSLGIDVQLVDCGVVACNEEVFPHVGGFIGAGTGGQHVQCALALVDAGKHGGVDGDGLGHQAVDACKRLAALEGALLDAYHAFRQEHMAQVDAVEKCILAYHTQCLGIFHIGEHRVVPKDAGREGLDVVGQADALEAVAAREGILAHALDCGRHGHLLEACALEGKALDGAHALWQVDALEAHARGEGVGTYLFYLVEVDAGERTVVPEHVLADGRETVGHDEGLERGALGEGVGVDARHLVAQGHPLERLAALEGEAAYLCHALGQCDFFERDAIEKCAELDVGDCRGEVHFFQITLWKKILI